ncbi:hypothetical protein LMG28138_03198 [Pararobbsia alpina]|uniref:Uncharacterized protein n=1 Tax=Pararobbsia alpina TaxID=621374 RepID=A0A6S7BHV0_9BURK|nr:hypothetical protein LMG28138_03198 [Pararobbsia alpina]
MGGTPDRTSGIGRSPITKTPPGSIIQSAACSLLTHQCEESKERKDSEENAKRAADRQPVNQYNTFFASGLSILSFVTSTTPVSRFFFTGFFSIRLTTVFTPSSPI